MALSLLSENKVGEVGILTNGDTCLRGNVAYKISESHKPAFGGDPGVPLVAERTAVQLNYPNSDYLPTRQDEIKVPFVITGSSRYEDKILSVTESAHLIVCQEFLDSCDAGLVSVTKYLKQRLPSVILYGSKGAGNVQEEHYKVLKRMEAEGVLVAKVPLRGGRVPAKMHYAVPGGDLLGLNIEQTTARYKSQMVLALADQLGVEQEQKKEFFEKMMNFQFGNELLPRN